MEILCIYKYIEDFNLIQFEFAARTEWEGGDPPVSSKTSFTGGVFDNHLSKPLFLHDVIRGCERKDAVFTERF